MDVIFLVGNLIIISPAIARYDYFCKPSTNLEEFADGIWGMMSVVHNLLPFGMANRFPIRKDFKWKDHAHMSEWSMVYPI